MVQADLVIRETSLAGNVSNWIVVSEVTAAGYSELCDSLASSRYPLLIVSDFNIDRCSQRNTNIKTTC